MAKGIKTKKSASTTFPYPAVPSRSLRSSSGFAQIEIQNSGQYIPFPLSVLTHTLVAQWSLSHMAVQSTYIL